MKGLAFIGLNIADVLLTKEAMSMGAVELMPLARIIDSLLWRGIVVAAVIAGLYYFGREKLLLPLNIALIGICFWNFETCFILKGGI